jgi:adenylosuccinate synthase
MPNVVVIGAQWGDEGKGKVVDIFTEFADIVVRYQGGNNAGHTLVINDDKTILHLIPSGIMHKQKCCVIGNGVVVDPEVLLIEIDRLTERQVLQSTKQLRLSTGAHVIMPYHKKLDLLREEKSGKDKIGTTGRGIGPCYEDKVGRRGIKVGELIDETILRQKLEAVLDFVNFQFVHYLGDSAMEVGPLLDQALAWGERLKPYLEETPQFVYDKIQHGRNVLFEGAQGTMLDIDHGTYPFVTSSNTVSASACSGSGIGPTAIDHVVGISKAYTTRVGMGPFPTELEGEIGERLRQRGAEYGSTTGRPRRCGWLDMVILKNASRLNGLTNWAITKLDVLTGFERIKLCVGYKYNGKVYDDLVGATIDLGQCEPVYEEMPGWDEDLSDVREFSELPASARKYLQRIEDHTGVKIALVSVGPRRGETIIITNPFRQ